MFVCCCEDQLKIRTYFKVNSCRNPSSPKGFIYFFLQECFPLGLKVLRICFQPRGGRDKMLIRHLGEMHPEPPVKPSPKKDAVFTSTHQATDIKLIANYFGIKDIIWSVWGRRCCSLSGAKEIILKADWDCHKLFKNINRIQCVLSASELESLLNSTA